MVKIFEIFFRRRDRLNALDYAQSFLPTHSIYAEDSAHILGKLDNGARDLGLEKGCESTTTATDPHEGVLALCLEGLSIYSQATNKFEEQRSREMIFSTVHSWREEKFPRKNRRHCPRLPADMKDKDLAYPGESPGSFEFLSNLASAYRRLPFEDMRLYLGGFISTQYNAVVDNITSTNNFYGNWPNPGTSLQRQLSNCYTLVAGLSLPEVSQSDPTTSPTITSSSSPTSDEVFGNQEINLGLLRRQQQFMAPPSIEPFTLHVEDKGQDSAQSQQRLGGKHSSDNNPGDPEGSIEQHERHEDSGWRPDPRLPPTYEDAV
ncbi:hypothetical protein VNI00_015190 [Paramarasmius palmivorus]|uniref:Uncharacterized protein n=1 Tax=Paramarasmius palmivorus TaxID=297713 RepID=A0AAW0BMF9_9AGAR